MKKIKLSKKDEEKWLELIKKNKREFIFKLYEHLEYKEAIDLVISNNLITELLLDKIEVRDKNNEYITYKYKFIDDAYIKDTIINLCRFIKLDKFKYDNLVLNQNAIDIMQENGIVIDLDKIYDKNIEYLEIENCIIEGSFDGYIIKGATIKDNKTKSGDMIKINPQKILDKNFYECKISNVEFLDSFDDCNISSIYISESKGVIINPQKVKYKNLSNCNIYNAKFIDSLDNCNIDNIELYDVFGAYVNAENLSFHHFSNFIDFEDINIIVNNDIGYNILKSYIPHLSDNDFAGATITCNSDIKNKLIYLFEENEIDYDDINFRTINLDVDDVLEDTLKFNSGEKEKTKKKSLFRRNRD